MSNPTDAKATLRAAQRRYYERHRDNPEWKAKRRAISRRYYYRNRDTVRAKRRAYHYNVVKPRECGIAV